MGTIIKRGDLQWQAKIRRHGFPIQTRTFSYKEDAEKWARTIERELDTVGFVNHRIADTTAFGDILARYLEEVTPTKRSAHVEAVLIRCFMRDPELAKLKMSALTQGAVAVWRDRRLTQVAAGTVNRELNVLSAVINHSRREWGVHIENPVAMVKRPPAPRARSRRLSPLEEQYLMDELGVSPRNADGTFGRGARNNYLEPIVMLALETAMRRGEMLSLLWENIDLEAQVAHLPLTKNGDSRDVPLSQRAVSILRNLAEDDDVPVEGVVFNTSADAIKKGFPRAIARARQTYLNDCLATGKKPKIGFLEDIHFHDLRHEATTRLSKKLSNVLELSAVTGHRDLRMLKRYYHPRAEDLAKKLG